MSAGQHHTTGSLPRCAYDSGDSAQRFSGRATGQAAGIAAAMAGREAGEVARGEVSQLRERLRRADCIVDYPFEAAPR